MTSRPKASSTTSDHGQFPLHQGVDKTSESEYVDQKFDEIRNGNYETFALHVNRSDQIDISGGLNRYRRDGDSDTERLYAVFQTRGYCVVEQAGRTAVVPEGTLALYANSLPYALRAGGPCEQVVLETSAVRAFALSKIAPTSDLLATTIDCTHGVLSAVAAFFVQLATHQAQDPLGAALLEPHAATLAVSLLALTAPSSTRSLPATIEQRRERAFAYLHSHFADPDLDAHKLAHEMGISIRSLYRLFEDSDRTPASYLRELRIDTAQKSLRKYPERPISTIARESGFDDERSFYRAFRRIVGRTPAEHRRLARGTE